MRTVQKTLLVAVLGAGLVVASLALRPARPSAEPASTAQQNAAAQQAETEELASRGVKYEDMAEDTDVSRDEAIAIAAKEVPNQPSGGAVSTRKVRMTSESRADIRNRPVWLVTFTGVAIYPHGPAPLNGASTDTRQPHTELTWMVDAETGADMGGYSDR